MASFYEIVALASNLMKKNANHIKISTLSLSLCVAELYEARFSDDNFQLIQINGTIASKCVKFYEFARLNLHINPPQETSQIVFLICSATSVSVNLGSHEFSICQNHITAEEDGNSYGQMKGERFKIMCQLYYHF